jgi:uncharacterized protein (DUF1015 family)
VPRFEPFVAVRYAAGEPLADVTAPPYDVLGPAERDAFAARHPHNIVHVDIPRDAAGRPDYALAGRLYRRWQDERVLERDRRPSFTIYRMAFTDAAGRRRTSTGVLGGLEVVDAGTGDVLPHERTTPKDRADRLRLTQATEANLSPIWALSLADGLTALLDGPGEPRGRFVDDAGVEHAVEQVDDPDRVDAISERIGTAVAVIADGHHRYEVARAYRDERRAESGAGPWDLTLAFVVELAEDQLTVEPIHRVLSGLPPGWEERLDDHFVRAPVDTPAGRGTLEAMATAGSLAVVHAGGAVELLTPRPGAFADVDDLDSARLAHALRDVEHEVRYEASLEGGLAELAAGRAEAVVLVRPVGVPAIQQLAADRSLMPPKSTFFTPKLRTGLVIRPMEA